MHQCVGEFFLSLYGLKYMLAETTLMAVRGDTDVYDIVLYSTSF